MNRRELLLLLAAAACGPPQKPPRRKRSWDAGVEEARPPIHDDWMADTRRGSQLGWSPLVVRDEQIARAMENTLEFVDVATLKKVSHVDETYRSICLLDNGMLLGFIKKGLNTCEIDVIKGLELGKPLQGPDCVMMEAAHLLPAGNSELYVARGNTLARYRIGDDAIHEVGQVPLAEYVRDLFNSRDQLIANGDGRVVAPNGKAIDVYEVGKPTVSYKGAERSIAHLAFGANGRVWYSRRNRSSDIQDIVLAKLADGLPADASLSVAPWRVIHMAAGPSGTLGVLIFDEKNEKTPWVMVYLDSAGKEQWRTPLDEALTTAVGVNLNLSFVAVTAKHVVLAPPGHDLVAWNAADGTPVR